MKNHLGLMVVLVVAVLALTASAPDSSAAPAARTGQVQFIEFYSPI